ncbi:SYNE1 [Lepeophtheirus salmonis]|uniref:SYNE1 n=1 Tax=Lepeophtheirus salmonis TaxID=72036 RepID=A0A7R8D630_LEPSM|nr:SYNE1 [Lepeophtheirus salmonis]CAF3041174.1 SYNE1 [Lepeophtheirus salmonis]
MVSGIPFVDSSKESIRKALSGNETFLKSIKKKSPELSQILNDSEVVLSGCHDLNVNVDLVRESVELLSMRWARLCSDAEQRKPFICDTEAEWKHFKENCQGLEEVLSTLDNETSQKGWESYRNRLGEINTKFCDMARKGRLDKKGDIKKLYQDINNGWVEKSRLENKPQWAREVNFLRGVDAQVTELQFKGDMKMKKEDEKYSEILLELWKRIHELLDINILPLYASQKSRSSVGATQYQELETPLLVASSSNVNLAEFSPSEIENELASISAVKEKLNSSTPKEKLKSELESSLSSFQAKLDLLYKYLKSPTPIKSEEISIVHDITERLLRVSRGYLDNSNYISEILMNNYGTDEEYARKGKINEMEGKLKELEEISHSKHKRVLNARRNVKQLDQDLWRLQKYIEMAHSTLGSLKTPPDSVEDLEDVFQDHREFLMEMDSHKSLMMSVNVVGKHLISHYKSQEKASELQNRLNVINAQWDEACEAAILWQIRLQTSFLQNAEFHRVVDDLSKWLDETTISIQSCEPINLNLPSDILQTKLEMFDDLLHDLKRCEPRIVSLRETADMLQIQLDKKTKNNNPYKLSRAIGHETGDSCEDLVVVPTLTDELLHLKDSSSTQRGLLSSTSSSFNVPPPSSSSIISSQEGDAIPSENGVLRRSYTFLGRVVRAAVPIQAIMLLLLGVSSIVPLNQEDLICTLQNNLERSFEPVIRWSNGPPPI